MKNKIKELSLVSIGLAIGLSWSVAIHEYQDILNSFGKMDGTVVVVNSAAVVQAKPTMEQNVSSVGESETAPTIGEIADRIYRLESSGGKNDICKKYGRYNGYGFGIYGNRLDCYDDVAIVREKVMAWFERETKNHSLKASLCRYNTGEYVEDCHYANDFYLL